MTPELIAKGAKRLILEVDDALTEATRRRERLPDASVATPVM